ncbi:MAG: hypothetical protein E6Q50_01345 [Lysobacter sp.]|nr:MAG: hypothetical protein E6Q50_01345 [Lysobacter sp.]
MSLLSAAIGISLIAGAPLSALSADFRTVRNPVAGEYIVVLKDQAASLATESATRARVPSVANQIASAHNARVVKSFSYALRGFVAKADDAALQRLLADPRVAYVEENGIISINATQSPATWGLDRVDQRNLPLSNSYTYDTTASGVHAYIIDTGVLLTHTEFSGRMGNGFDAVTTGGNANDCHGHGTHVAGTVGGTTYGVAKGVTIHPVRVLGCTGSGTNAGVIAGMEWVAQNRILPAVANMSLGGGAAQAVDDAVQTMTNAGVTVVVAAGNDNGSDACTKSPARAPSAITVGSTTSTDARSSFSNIGTCVDIFAPGSSITSAWYTSTTATNTISGTSMASPHVAGAAALYLATNPTATPAQVTSALNAAATPGVVGNAGTGSPNRLLYTLGGTAPVDTTPPSTVSGLTATASGSAQINLSWSAATDTGGSGLAGYKIERCAGAGCTNFAQIATSTTASYSNTGLTASTSYSYRVRAYDGAGNNGGYSATATATTSAGGGGGSELTKGVPVTGLAATTGASLNYTMVVPAGSTNLTFTLSGGTGDADMYVKFGSAPTDTVYDCRPYLGGNAETCTFAAPSAGTYYVRVKAYSTFSGVSLVGNYTTGGGGGGTQTYTNTNDYTISDNTTVNSPIAVSGRTGNGQASTPVAVNIVHTYIGDLVVSLVAPDGSVYVLHNRTGGSADNINTTYNVNLSGEALNGTWNLRVQDAAGGDVGYINSWSVTF